VAARRERGFVSASLRSHLRSRYYGQCPIDEKLENWPDERIGDQLKIRLGPEAAAHMAMGPSIGGLPRPGLESRALLLADDPAHAQVRRKREF
jgi:hypothetical protein